MKTLYKVRKMPQKWASLSVLYKVDADDGRKYDVFFPSGIDRPQVSRIHPTGREVRIGDSNERSAVLQALAKHVWKF